MQPLQVNLWFDTEAEDAAKFYTSIFPNSEIGTIARYPDAGQDVTGMAAGQVMTVTFMINGLGFIGLNGGPQPNFKFNEGISFVVNCSTQEEIDKYWNALGANGGGEDSQCGWLKDKYGVSWQIVTPRLEELLSSADAEAGKRVMEAMLKMQKLDIAALESAASAGTPGLS